MTVRLLIGGPSNSGKSTFILSVTEALKAQGFKAESLEFDVWSNSYPAFRGEVSFEGRPKRFDANQRDTWWQEKLRPRIARFMSDDLDYAFGDLPGVLGVANSWTCQQVRADGAVVISHSLEGLKDWTRFFRDDLELEIIKKLLSVKGKHLPVEILPDMDRKIDPHRPQVRDLVRSLTRI